MWVITKTNVDTFAFVLSWLLLRILLWCRWGRVPSGYYPHRADSQCRHTPTEKVYHNVAGLRWRLRSPGGGEGLIMHPIWRSGVCSWKPGLDNDAWTLWFHLKPNDEFTFHFLSVLQRVALFLPHWWSATKLWTTHLMCVREMSHLKSSFSRRSSKFFFFFLYLVFGILS